MSLLGEVRLELYKEVKHSVRYDSKDEGAIVKSVYVAKTGLTKPWPKAIVLKVEEGG